MDSRMIIIKDNLQIYFNKQEGNKIFDFFIMIYLIKTKNLL